MSDEVSRPLSPNSSGHSAWDIEDEADDAPTAPGQRRLRITQACDQCRHLKIKCDGKKPCARCCLVHSYPCTYNKPSKRGRILRTQYVDALKSRLQRAETLLREFIPDVDLSDPDPGHTVQQEFRNRELAPPQAKLRQDQMVGPNREEVQLLSLVEPAGQLDLADKDGWVFHVHTPSFYDMFDRVYEKPYENLTHEEQRYLGLLYAVMALGCMYNNLDDYSPPLSYTEAVDEGQVAKYFYIARRLLRDITQCRDLTSLQALLFMILYLQAASDFSGSHAFVGVALRSAEVRKRVFYAIRQIDIYVSAMLGLPLLLNLEDVDQRYPTEVDDEYITNDGIIQPPPGTISFFEAFNAHTKLVEILARILKFVYPLKDPAQNVMKGDNPGTRCIVSSASVKMIEGELQEWYEMLSSHWRPNPEGPIEVIRVRHLLRSAYAHVQLILYRPFLHYVSPCLSVGMNVDELSYSCAAAGISVSRNIVRIGIEIRKQGVLPGYY
ncbi:fungal specific transcription factor factor [Fusarium beomiforme]|uniref:Fungal specific transcription factor factor n=1 Tax=Fusarium beomiforme TaxID=44412 RepID=A0A9P5A5W9_9HYPO|nr:fungal specific transcription factor factor [Fusarium beomiforme]